MDSIHVTIERRADATHLHLSGAIDETVDLERVFSGLQGAVVIHLEGLRRINSMGVHRWVPAITRLAKDRAVTVEAISYPVVMQANCVANFFGPARVGSCVAPYFCPACKKDRQVIVTREEVEAHEGGAPRQRCPECQGLMELDELDGYFGFFGVDARAEPGPPR